MRKVPQRKLTSTSLWQPVKKGNPLLQTTRTKRKIKLAV
jgi:hypothetical protein